MHKTLRNLSLFVLLSVANCAISVASAGIAVTFIDYRFDSTQNVNLGYTLTISAQVRNTDTVQSFSGFLDFGLHNNGNILSAETIFNKPPYSGRAIMLNPGEVVPAVFSIDIDHPYFTPGPDVVVVWPISSSPIADSIIINLLIQSPNSVAKKELENFTYMITNNQIHLFYPTNETNFKQVRILNILGQEAAYLHSDFITEVPVPTLPKGVYLCEMISAEGKTKVIKFVH